MPALEKRSAQDTPMQGKTDNRGEEKDTEKGGLVYLWVALPPWVKDFLNTKNSKFLSTTSTRIILF